MLSVFANIARVVLPAAAGPVALFIVPTIVYVLVNRKVDISISLK